ncbi:hypothetical protein FSP39_011214 [Pinctada imbricata]|uniref:protein-tyrosine-phosphatase n=1 Tax=Pinctada imbricata TaxID=66713 RepID=A0AA89BSN3_PINIB|nr:hypothetical protein FSP39_011214 [Pinctada imbricata]
MTSDLEKEFLRYDEHNAWVPIFQVGAQAPAEIKNQASVQAIEEGFSTAEARKPVNRTRNRYRDVSPYDHSRIELENSVYINASLLRVPEANRRYILTQGPLESTSGHFWQMVWEQKSNAVIMLNKLKENGMVKCHPYYPITGSEEMEEMVFEDVNLKVTVMEETTFNFYVERSMEIENMETGETHEVLHFNYTHWPDFGVPHTPLAFLNFLMAVRESGCLESDVGPAIIHCSAGIGRSGTFCLADSALILIEKSKSIDSVDVRSMLLDMRKYRMGLIQTPDQLRFSFQAIIEGGKRILAKDSDTMDVLSSYSELKNHKDEGPPPPPPTRTSSLSPKHTSEMPPPIPPRAESLNKDDMVNGDEDDIEDEEDYVNMRLHPKPEEDELDHKENKESQSTLRRRQREERKKSTQEQIRIMKEKQRKSELWRNRRSYVKPVAIGIALLIGGLIMYRYYWRF